MIDLLIVGILLICMALIALTLLVCEITMGGNGTPMRPTVENNIQK